MDDVNLSRIQGNVENALDAILSNHLLDSRILTGIVMTAGVDKAINHGLGRKLEGWIVIGVSADTRIFDKQTTNAQPTATLILNSVNTATVNLLVF